MFLDFILFRGTRKGKGGETRKKEGAKQIKQIIYQKLPCLPAKQSTKIWSGAKGKGTKQELMPPLPPLTSLRMATTSPLVCTDKEQVSLCLQITLPKKAFQEPGREGGKSKSGELTGRIKTASVCSAALRKVFAIKGSARDCLPSAPTPHSLCSLQDSSPFAAPLRMTHLHPQLLSPLWGR